MGNLSSKKIAIFYTAIGMGHKSIAENIGYVLSCANYRVSLYNILEIENSWLAKLGQKLHRIINLRLSFFWDWLYTNKRFLRLSLPYRVRLAGKNYQRTLAIIQAQQPVCVITTQTTASAIVAYLKKKHLYSGLFGIAFSDFHLHPYWLYEQADFYLANTDEQKREMTALGIDAAKIFVCGITLKPKSEIDAVLVKKKLGIASGEKVILAASGSLGYGIDKSELLALSCQFSSSKIIVVCGKNAKTAQALKQAASGFLNLMVLDFYSPMYELYGIADIFLTKPGGLSVAEALQWNLPMLITHTLPGQEELNYQYLLKRQLIMPKSENIIKAIQDELAFGAFRASLSVNLEREKILGRGGEILNVASRLFNGV